MSKARQTQCPSCGSTFQVNHEQLEVASGTVRCGNCLNVFQADDYFVDEEAENPPAIAATSNFYETAELDPDDNVDESWALELLKELEDEPETEAATKQGVAGSPTLTEKHTETAPSEPILPTLNTEEDEKEQKDELSDTFQNIDQWTSEATHDQFGDFNETHGAEADSENTNDPESEEWAKKILENDELDQADNPSQEETEPAPSKEDKLDTSSKDKPPADPFGVGEELKGFASKSDKPTVSLDAKEVIATIELEPVELDLNSHGQKKAFRFIGEALLVSLASLVLITQYLTHNFDSLSKDPQLRPWYKRACSTLNCTLPQQSDIAKVKGKNLVVRTHPDIPDALLVDIVITNHARFSQKLPLLELTFSDINGFPVAGRRFKPSEYLSGALLKLKSLPANTPLHLSLSIFDPGDEAINYHVNFYESK